MSFSTLRKQFVAAVLAVVVMSPCAFAAPRKNVLKQNFDGAAFKDGKMPLNGTASDGSAWEFKPVPNMEIVKADGSQALQIRRVMNFAAAEFFLKEKIVDGADYRISFKFIIKAGGRMFMQLRDADNQVIGGVKLYESQNPAAYSASMLWQAVASGSELLAGVWHVVVDVDHGNSEYTMTLTGKDGKVIKCQAVPLLRNSVLHKLFFGNCLPVGDNAVIDDISVECDSLRSVKNRRDLTSVGKINAKGKEIDVLLDVKSSFNTIRVYGEADNPFEVEAINSMGHNVELGSVPAVSGAEFRQLDFKTEEGQQIKVIFKSLPRSTPKVIVYEAIPFNRNKADQEFQKKIVCEFVCPVYQQKTGNAQLHLINTTASPIPVMVDLTERYSKKLIVPARAYTLVPGDNFIDFDISELPTGHFVATVKDASVKNAVLSGSTRRLLRREILPDVKPEWGKDFSGQKMMFPDEFYMTEKKNLKFVPASAELHQITQKQVTPGNTYQRAEHIGVTPDGKLEVIIHSNDNKFTKGSVKRLRAVASIDDLDNWSVTVDGKTKASPNPNPVYAKDPRLDNRPKPGPDGKIRYRFYDPVRDGKVNVSQVTFRWISFHDSSHVGGQEVMNFEGYIPQRRTTWPIWYKSPGEALVLSRKPLFTDHRGGGEFEDESDSNDNSSGTWLSADGKYICFGSCNTMRRHPPRGITFDNLSKAIRILRVLRTSDGINYERFSMAVPFPDDPPATQHYCIRVGKVANGGGLMTGLVYNYNAYEQRIFLDLTYSYDGYTWKRFHGCKPFVDNGPHGSLTSGYVAANMAKAVEIGDKVYCVTDYVSDAYHILAELMWGRSDAHALTEQIMQKHILPRAEAWPLRHRFANFKEMAEYASNVAFTVALLSWRKDGLFSVQPVDGKIAEFTTIPIKAGKTLRANLQVADGGSAEFELLDRNGKTLSGYRRKIGKNDATGLMIFDNLPEGEFRIRVKLDKAFLYALSF